MVAPAASSVLRAMMENTVHNQSEPLVERCSSAFGGFTDVA